MLVKIKLLIIVKARIFRCEYLVDFREILTIISFSWFTRGESVKKLFTAENIFPSNLTAGQSRTLSGSSGGLCPHNATNIDTLYLALSLEELLFRPGNTNVF